MDAVLRAGVMAGVRLTSGLRIGRRCRPVRGCLWGRFLIIEAEPEADSELQCQANRKGEAVKLHLVI